MRYNVSNTFYLSNSLSTCSTPCKPTPENYIGRSWWKSLGYGSKCKCGYEHLRRMDTGLTDDELTWFATSFKYLPSMENAKWSDVSKMYGENIIKLKNGEFMDITDLPDALQETAIAAYRHGF